MRIERVEVKKLFGIYDYSIKVNDTVTIIHGVNGCGKTTMLKIIDAAFNKKLDFLKSTDFRTVHFIFSDNSSLFIERKRIPLKSFNEENGIYYLVYKTIIDGKEAVYDAFENPKEIVDIIEKSLRIMRPMPFLERISDGKWLDRRDDSLYSTDEIFDLYGDRIYRRYASDFIDDSIPENIELLLSTIKVRLISADRLTVQQRVERSYRDNSDNYKVEQRVDIIAKDVSQRIKDTIQEYAQLSQAKDRTFPIRAIRAASPMSVEDIKNKMFELEAKRKEFIETGILQEEKDDIDIHELVESVTENNRQNLSLYAIDTEEKLNALSSLSSAINHFRTLIDNSFTNKRIVFNKDYGFKFITAYSSTLIPPHKLSSGEQHELVMLYDLIFNTTPDMLILIDEPELSLHIKWQLSYLDELLKIINRSSFYAVLATHSPQIIHDRWDLTISLSDSE